MKILEQIGKLNMEERKGFRLFLQSGIANNPPGLLTYFDGCICAIANNPSAEEEELMAEIFPADNSRKEKQNYARVRLSHLTQLLHNFLSYKELISDFELEDYCLYRAFQFKGWTKEAASQVQKITKKKMYAGSMDFTRFAHFLEITEINWGNPAIPLDRHKPLFQETLEDLDRMYLIKKLSLTCKALAQDNENKTSHHFSFLPEVVKWASASQFENDSLIQLYSAILQMMTGPGSSENNYFQKAKDLLFQLAEEIKKYNKSEFEDIFALLVNFCVRAYNRKEVSYGPEVTLLYNKFLINDPTNGSIDARNFKNIFFIFLSVNEIQSAETFCNRYEESVPGDSGSSTIYLCRGHLHFKRKEIELASAALDSAFNILPAKSDFQLEAEIRAMKIKMDLLLGDYSGAEYKCRLLIGLADSSEKLDPEKAGSFGRFSLYARAFAKATLLREKGKLKALLHLQLKLEKEKRFFYSSVWLKGFIAEATNPLA